MAIHIAKGRKKPPHTIESEELPEKMNEGTTKESDGDGDGSGAQYRGGGSILI